MSSCGVAEGRTKVYSFELEMWVLGAGCAGTPNFRGRRGAELMTCLWSLTPPAEPPAGLLTPPHTTSGAIAASAKIPRQVASSFQNGACAASRPRSLKCAKRSAYCSANSLGCQSFASVSNSSMLGKSVTAMPASAALVTAVRVRQPSGETDCASSPEGEARQPESTTPVRRCQTRSRQTAPHPA